MFDLNKLIRENIKDLQSYVSPRDTYGNDIKVLLDANENSLGSPLPKWVNRYPSPYQQELREAISQIKVVKKENIMLGNGSDECIDILLRCFCTPQKDNIIVCPPAYPSYETYATVNDIEVRKATLLDNFQLDLIHLENLADENTRIIWLTSPNDSTGNSLNRADVELVLNNFSGLVVIDEAYINFAKQKSFLQELAEYPNLVVLQTFGKAWGLAALRLATAFASEEIIEVLHRVKPPYNISQPVMDLALNALEEVGQVNDMIRELGAMRDALAEVFNQIPFVEKVYPSDANFLLVKMIDATKVYEFLLSRGIAVRNMNNIPFCEGCLRITVGTEQENTLLIDALAAYLDENLLR